MTQVVAHFKASKNILGISWQEILPIVWEDYWLDHSSYDEFVNIRDTPGSFFVTSDNSNDNFLKDKNSYLKEKYLRHFCDFFTIKLGQKIIGVVVCEILDWSSYYLRFITIEKEHRNKNLTLKFVSVVESVMANVGIDKVICDVSPANLGQVGRMSSAGYLCTGSFLSERFGANLRLTRYLSEDSKKKFDENFIQIFYPRTSVTMPLKS